MPDRRHWVPRNAVTDGCCHVGPRKQIQAICCTPGQERGARTRRSSDSWVADMESSEELSLAQGKGVDTRVVCLQSTGEAKAPERSAQRADAHFTDPDKGNQCRF